MATKHPVADGRTLSPFKSAWAAGIAAGALVLVGMLALLLYPDPLVNRFIRPRIAGALAEAYPAYTVRMAAMKYSVFENRFEVDSISVGTADSTFSSTIGPVSVRGIGWMHLLWGGSLVPHDFADAVVDARDIILNFTHSQYELRCGLLRVSVPDSDLTAETLTLHPSVDDEQFFEKSAFRRTRFRLAVPNARARGVACLELLQGEGYRIRSAQLQNVLLTTLINKDKPGAKVTENPRMPNEILSSIHGMVQADSLSIVNGRLLYGERIAAGSSPAVITIDSMQVLTEGIVNHGDSGAAFVIHVRGRFMNAGTMSVRMAIPVVSSGFSYQYSGSLSEMDLGALNAFLEEAEQMRIKTGVLRSATFEITVASGHARGTVRAVYRDLTVAAINKRTGSEAGFGDGVASFIANTFKIRGNNMPDAAGATEPGEVDYARKQDEAFLEFTWFALRSGLAHIVGF